MYTAKPQTRAQLEAASLWTREAGGASKAISSVPAMRPRDLLGASCESNGSKGETLKSGAVGSRVLAGQRLKQADFTFQDPSRGSGTTTHVPSADPRTLQLHLRDFPFSPPPPPFFAPLQARTTHEGTKTGARAHYYPPPHVLHTVLKSFKLSQESIAFLLGHWVATSQNSVRALPSSCARACSRFWQRRGWRRRKRKITEVELQGAGIRRGYVRGGS